MLGFDMDGCILDINSAFVAEVNLRLNTQLTIEDITSHEVNTILPIPPGEIWPIYTEIINSQTLPAYDDAIAFINERAKPACIITARVEHNVRDASVAWLQRHLTVPFEMVFTNLRSKLPAIKAKGITSYVEDSESNAIELANHGIQVFLVDRPWNKNCYHKNITRIFSFTELNARVVE